MHTHEERETEHPARCGLLVRVDSVPNSFQTVGCFPYFAEWQPLLPRGRRGFYTRKEEEINEHQPFSDEGERRKERDKSGTREEKIETRDGGMQGTRERREVGESKEHTKSERMKER